MMLVLVLVAVISVVAGGPTVPGCCTPPQWEGYENGLIGQVQSGTPRVTQESIGIAYDETNNKVAYSTLTEEHGVLKHFKIIQDFTQHKMFVINVFDQTCTTSAFTGTFNKICLPAQAKLSGTFYYGIGKNKFPVVAFTMFVHDTNVTAVFTPDDCIPVGEVSVKSQQPSSAMMQSVGFIDLTAGIRNSSVFTPPSSCSSVSGKPKGLYSQPEITRHGLLTHKLHFNKH